MTDTVIVETAVMELVEASGTTTSVVQTSENSYIVQDVNTDVVVDISQMVPTVVTLGAQTVPALIEFDDVAYTQGLKMGDPAHIDSLQEVVNHMWSAGVVDGCALTDNGNGTISIASGTAVLHPSDDPHTNMYAIAVAAQANIALTDDTTNYVYINYNAGTPIFSVSTSIAAFNCIDKCLAYMVHRKGTVIHAVDAREQNVDGNRKSRRLFLSFSRFIHAGGGTSLGATGLAITVTPGSFYFMLEELPHGAFDTTVAGTANANVFTLWYRNGVGGWTETANQKTVVTTTYDGNTGTPVTLGNNKVGVTWFYIVNDAPSELHAVMGQVEYAHLVDASVATPPGSIPSLLAGLASLIGFVVYEKGVTTFDSVRSAFSTVFGSSAAVTHNGLAGLQGGVANEYYHLTAAQHAALGSSSGSGAIGVPGSDGEDGESAFIVLNSQASSAGTGLSHQEVLSRVSFRM